MEPPLFPTGGPQIVRAAPGTVANVVLPLAFGSPPVHYKWSRAGASLDDRFITSDDAGGVRLTVSAARTGDSGVYTLQASNAAGKDTTRVRLEVSPDEAPVGDDPPNFLRRLQDLTVKVGTRTRFLVEIVSSTECKVTWYRNERRLMETERVALVRDGNFWCADVATVSVDDAGRWTCTAENVGGRASCSAHLNVLVPKAYKRPEFVEELRALLTEQGTVSLECKVVGVPTPVLRWFKDSREIKAGDVFALTANADDPTSLGTYTCEAVNCMGRAYSSSKVHVVGRASREGSMRPSSGGLTPDPPPIFTKELEDQFVRICEPLNLSCHIVVPPWPRSVVWYNKEGKIEPSERYHVLEDGVGGYLLEVCSAEWADEGEWKCVASTAGGRVGMSSCYVSMDVPKNYRKPRFMENLQAVLTEEGLVSFECKVVGFPTPVLSWFKDGQELKPGDVYQLTGTNSLGSYCCIAKNCMGQASSSAELTVEDIQNQLNEEEKHQLFSKNQAPKFLQGLKSVEAKIDEPFRFTIKVAIPPEPSLLWYRDDQPVDESSRCHHGKEDRGVFHLDIQNLEFLDQAEWKCVAMNDFGQSVTSCFLKLIIPRHYKKPRFLENLQAILSDEGAVNLECKVIGVPQPVLKWYKDGEELKPGDIHRIISGQDGTCCLGTYTCEAQNCMGIAASSASLLGFDDSMKVKSKKKSEEQTLQRNLSLSTIHEERTSQMYDTPVGDRTLDDKGEISFSFDGKEVSVSLYETPDLTEEEALQIVEMYADQLSENVTEHNVVELPPLRFVKETSTSGNLLMEAIIIDVSPDYFASPEEDLRTEADIEDISIADENGPLQISLDQDQEMSSQDYLEKTMALLSDEKSDIPKKVSRKFSDSQRSGDDYFSLSHDHSLSEEKKYEDTQILSESDLQSFASAKSSAKLKSKSSKPSMEDPNLEIVEVTNKKLFKEDVETITTKPDVPVPKLRRRSSRGSRRSSSGSEKSLGKLKDDKDIFIEQPHRKLIGDEECNIKINQISNSLSKVLNDIQIIERDIILQSELMSSAATASKSLEIIGSLIAPLSDIQNITESAKEATSVSSEINSTLFNNLAVPFKVLYQSLTIIEKCVDVESDNKTLVKKTCVSLIEKCGNEIQSLVHDINTLISKKYLGVDEIIMSQVESLSNEMITILKFSADTIKARNLLHEASEFKSEGPSLQHSRETQKAIFELKTSLRSLLRIVETTERDDLPDASKINSSEIILNDMSASIQDLQEALEQIESLSIKESTSSLNKYNTEIIETVMDSIVKLRSSFEQLSVEAKKEDNENTLKQVLSTVKLNLNEISSHINVFENKVGKFDILQGENKLEVLQKMAQTLISFENSLPVLDILPDIKENMVTFHKHLTSILENVIEGNECAKYFAFLEICDTIRRLNNSIKNMESHDLFSFTSISNTLKIIEDQLVHEIFTPDLNCAILSSIEEVQRNLLKNINFATEITLKADFDSIQDLQVTKQDELEANVVIQSIEHSITAINHVINEEFPKELKTAMSPILESIRPNLENLKQNIACLIATETEHEEHVSELSERSVTMTLANPLCELNQNIIVLNQTLLENADSFKENSEVGATCAQPLHELLTMLEVLQHEVISQHEEYISPSVISNSIANVIDNLQSCVLLIQEQSGVETADEMSTLEDVSGMKTNAEIIPTDHQGQLTTQEVYAEQLADKLKETEPYSVTAQTLRELNEHAIILQHPNVLEFLDVLSECNDYTSLKSVTVRLEELNEGIQEILHPILVENMNEFSDSLNTSKLTQIAMPMYNLYHSLLIVDASNIPIYENILKMPSEQVHSVIEKLSDFKEHLEKCLSAITPAKETTDIKTLETLSNMDATKRVCVDLKNIIQDLEQTSVGLNPEVTSFKHTLTHFLDAIDQQDHVDAETVKTLLTNVNEKLLLIQDDLIQCKPQPCETITQEVKLIETIHQLEKNIAVLEQYEFVDLSAYDIDSNISPQLAQEINADSLIQIEDLVRQAVNIVQDVGHASQTADLMILEDFFRNCKVEFSMLRCLITKRPSHKKIIRLFQEFNYLRFIIQNFKNKQGELSLSSDMVDLLTNFMSNLDTSMKDIEDHLIKIANSQSKLLIEMPLANLNENYKKLRGVLKVGKEKQILDFLNVFLQFIEDMRPNFDNLRDAVIEELQSTHTNIDRNTAFDESMDLFVNYIEKELVNVGNENQYKTILENICSCVHKHQDYKGIVGQSKALMLLKCLSECSTALIQIFTDEREQNKQPLVESEVIELKSVLSEMVEPLQGLRSQLISIQEQISFGADEESISIGVTSSESYLQALTEINNDVLQLLQSDKAMIDETDLSLIDELDKELHIIQENIQLAESTAAADVSKQIASPLESIENTLHIAKEKMSMEMKNKIPRDINSNVSSLEYFLNRFIELETDLLETSELVTDIDIKKCLSVAIEITSLLNPRVLSCDIDSADVTRHEKLIDLRHLLMKFDWLNTERFCENRDEVMIQKLKRVFLSAYQLLSELNNSVISLHGPDPTVSEDKAEALLQHIDQYIEFVEIVEEVSAVIKIDDLLETANIARELRESIDDGAKCNQEIGGHIDIDTTQELLIHKLHRALSELEVQTLDSVLEMVPTFEENKKQHVIEVLALLKSDLTAIAGSQIAVLGPENALETFKPLDLKTEAAELKLIFEDSKVEANLDVCYTDVETVFVEENENIVVLKEIGNQEYSADLTENIVASSVEDQKGFATAQSLLTTTPTIGTLLEHIDEYICDDVMEVVSQLAATKDIKGLVTSVNAAKELRESIIALQVSPAEVVTVLQNEQCLDQGDSICQLREALSILEVLTLHNTEELKDMIGYHNVERITNLVQNLHADINVIAFSDSALIKDEYQQLEAESRDILQMQDSESPLKLEGQVSTKVFEHISELNKLSDEEKAVSTSSDIEQSDVKTEVFRDDDGSNVKDVDLSGVSMSNVKDLLDAQIDQVPDMEDIDSMEKLETLLNEVTNQVELYSTVHNTEFLRNTLDEVQTVIIKLKRDFDGSANDTLNETLEDLECSVRSVQLQIDENSAPNLLKDACATLQLLVTNMSDIKGHVSHPASEQTANTILQKCSEQAEQTIELLDKAAKADDDSQVINMVSKINNLKDILKILWTSFQGTADALINNGIDINQRLDQMEGEIYSLEKEIDGLSCEPNTKDTIIVAVHAVYENISNMRSAISSIQKEFMYKNYGIPSEKFLHSLKNITIIHKIDNNVNWKHFGKVLRQVLNHFEDIKFYVNFDKTARIPSDAAFTKIILDELTKELKCVVLADVLESHPEKSEEVQNVIKSLEEYILSLESRSTLEVKEKIPIFKNISELMLLLTDDLIKTKKDLQSIQKVEALEIQELSHEIPEDINISESTVSHEQLEEMVTMGPDENKTSLSSVTVQDVSGKNDASVETADLRFAAVGGEENLQASDKSEESIQSHQVEKRVVEESELMLIQENKIENEQQENKPLDNLQVENIGKEAIESNITEEQEIEHQILTELKEENINDQITEAEPSCSYDVHTETEELLNIENVKNITKKDNQESIVEQTEQEGMARLEKEKRDAQELQCAEEQQSEDKVELEELNEELEENEKTMLHLEQQEQEICMEEHEVILEKDKKEAEIKPLDEETLHLEKVVQDAEEELIEGKSSLGKEEEELEIKGDVNKELRVETDDQEAKVKQSQDIEGLEKEKEDAEIKTNQEEIPCLERENQEAAEIKNSEEEILDHDTEKQEEKHLEHKKCLEEREDSEIKFDEDDVVCQEKMKQEAEEMKLNEKARLEKEDADITRVEEETLDLEMEERKAKKTQKREKAISKHEIEDAETKHKEGETVLVEKEKQETESTQKDEKEKASLEKEEFNIKCKEVETVCLKKDKIEEKQVKEEVVLEKEEEDTVIKHKEETLLVEKEKQRTEEKKDKSKIDNEKQKSEEKIEKARLETMEDAEIKRKEDKTLHLEKEEGNAEIKKREEETLRVESEKQESEEKTDKATLQKKKEDAEIKSKEGDTLRLEKEKQEAEEKKEKARLEKVKEDVEIKCKEEETLSLEKKEQAEEKHQKDKAKLEQDKKDTDIKRKEEEALPLDKKEQKLEMQHQEEKANLQKEKEDEDAVMKRKNEETLRIEKEKLEAEDKNEEAKSETDKQHAEMKRKEEQTIRLEKEKQEAEETKETLEKEKEDAEIKRKEEESLRLEKKKQDAEENKEKAGLEKEKEDDAEIKRKEETLRLQKEKQEAEQARLEKEKEDAEIQRKEEETLRLQKEKQEAEQTKDKATLQKEKDEAEIKHMEEESLRLEKEKQEAKETKEKARLEKETEDAEIHRKEEETLRLKKEKQEAVEKKEKARLEEAKEDAEIKHKEDEILRLKKENEEAEQMKEKTRLEKEKEEAEIKHTEEETLRLEKEKEEAEQMKEEARLEKEKEEAEIKRKEEETLRLEKEKQESEENKDKARLVKEKKEAEIKRKEEETHRLEKEKEEAEIMETLRLEKEKQESEENKDKARLEKEKEEAEIKRKEEESLRIEKEKQEAKEKNKDAEIKRKEEDILHQEKEKRKAEEKKEKAGLDKEKEKAEIKCKEEEIFRLEKEKEEAEEKKEKVILEKEKEETEIKQEEAETVCLKTEEQEAGKKKEKRRIEKDKDDFEVKRKEEEESLRLDKEKQRAEEEQGKARLEKEKENAEIKRKQEKTLLLEKEKQEAEEKKEKARLDKEKEAAEIKRKEEETLRREKEKQGAEEKKEKARLEKEKEAAELKCKEEETLCLEKEKQEAEEKKEKARLEKEKQDAEIKRKKEETLCLEKEKQEAEEKKEKARLEKEKEEAEMKRKEEEILRQEKEKQVAEEQKQRARLEKEKQDSEIKHKEEETLRLEKEKQETEENKEKARLEKEKKEAEIKRKQEESLRLEKEKQEAEQMKNKTRLEKEKEEDEIKRKEEETLRLEKEKREAEGKKEKARLDKEKEEAEIKCKEEETLRREKEKKGAEEKKEKARLEKEKEAAELKRKEEENLRLEKEKEEAEIKRKKEEILRQEKEKQETEENKEKARLEKEKKEAEIKRKEEESLHLEKEKQEAEQMKEKARLEKEKEEAEIKCKEEETLRREKEKKGAEEKKEKARLEKEKEAAEIKRKEEETLRLEKEKREAEGKKEKARLDKEKEEAEIKCKEEETLRREKEKKGAEEKKEKARLEKEKEAAELKRKEEENLRLEKEKEEAEIKRKKEEILRQEKEKQETEENKEKARLEKEKKEAEIKRKEEESLHLEKEKQEAEQMKEKARLEKEKEEAEIKRKEEETLRLEKEKQEAEVKKEKAKLEKDKEEAEQMKEKAILEKEEAEIKRKKEETLRLEKEKQEAEEMKEKARLEKEKEVAEIKRKEEETLRLEKERQEAEEKKKKARLEKEKEEAEIKRKEEETLRLEKERQEAEEKKQKARLEKEKEEAEIKRNEEEILLYEKEKREAEETKEKAKLKTDEEEAEIKRKKEETLRLEKEKQEAEEKKEKARLEKEKEEAEIKRKEEETLRLEKEKREAEEKKEKAKLEKDKEEAEIKRKKEETLLLEKEKQEAEEKKEKARLEKEKEKARLEKEKEEAEIKRKEEETLRLEKEEQEAEEKKEKAKLEKDKEEAEIKRKKEETLRLEKEKQEAEEKKEKARLEKEKEEAEMKRKEEETLRLEKEKQEAEEKKEKARLEKEKQDAEIKRKEEETLRFEREKEEAKKKKSEDKMRSKKEKKDSETKRKKEEIIRQERENQHREKQLEDKARVDSEVQNKERKLGLKTEPQEIHKEQFNEAESSQKDDRRNFEQQVQKTDKHCIEITKPEFIEKPMDSTEKYKAKDEHYEIRRRDDSVYKLNGSVDKYKIGEIDISSSDESKHERKEKLHYINYNNNNNIGLEMYTPPGYIEKRTYENNRFSSLDIDTTKNIPPTYKAQTLLYQSQLRASTPLRYEVGRSSESTEKLDSRCRSKALSESRSSVVEKRSSALRDHKRKPVFSTHLTDRTAVEASRVKLTCSVLSSSDPTITWFKNGVLLDNKLKYKTKVVDGLITLEVLNAVPSDSAEYTCTVQNESGSVSTSANLKVYPSFEASPIPPTFTRSIRDTYHLAENELVLESRIRGQPLPTITWLKDGRPLCDDERYQAYYLADGVCRLVINAPVTTDSGRYTCKAENSMWSDQITHVVNFTGKESSLGPNLATIDRSRFNRQVLESRRPHFTNVLTDYKVTRGGTIGLQVEIKGSPTRVEWLREGNALTDTHRNAQTFVDRGLYTLALSDVTEKESGLYTCRAWSSHGNVDMNAAITVVQPNELEGKPAIIVGRPEKDVLISVGEDLNISFRAQGEPKPKVIFMKGIRDITNSQRVCKMTSDDYVKFTLKRTVVSDAGTYCVLARNAYGCDRAFVTVVVRQRASSENLISDWTYSLDDTVVSTTERKYKSVPDRIPGEPSVVDGGNNWVSLAWPKPEHQETAPVLAYKVENWLIGKEGGARWIELGITPLNSFDAFNLKQGEEYHFRVTPRNRYGWGEPVQTSSAIGIGLAGDRPEFTETLPGQLKVLVGETANLSCSFKGKPTPEIIWMKNGHEIEDDDVRVKTLLNGCNCYLTIEDVQVEDEARYSCEASNVHGRASTYARMAVITDRLVWEADAKLKRERSAGMEGEYPPQFTMRLRDRRVQATYPVRLTCQVIGNPPPVITWFKDGSELQYDNRHNKCQDEHFHTLEIAPTSLEDGGVYEAMARNTSGAVSCRCSLVVDKGIRAYVAPDFCCGLEPLYRLHEGEELRISAMVEAYPSVGVTWYRDGVRLRPSRRAIMTLDHDGQIELALASVTPRDAGVYMCTASNEVGQASTSGKVEVIGGDQAEEKTRTPPVVISPDVPYSKEPMFTRKPRSSEAREGDTVIIECEVIGDPKPDVYWLRDFLKPDYYRDANHFKRVGAGPQYRFEIPHAKLDYTGTYSVVAHNAHGEAKAIISLQILAKDIDASDDAHNVRYGRVDVIPRFDKELTDLLCYDGDAVEFECRVSGDPEPYIKWLHYNEVIRDSQDFESCYEDGTARLKIKQVTAEDEGTYTCEASNSLGKAKSSACLVVYPPGEPNTLSQRLRRPPALLSAASTPRSTPRPTPARSLSRTPGPDPRRLCSPSREIAPKFYTYPFNKVVEEGERVVFKCAVKGLPNPWATWDKDGIILTPTSRITMREKDDILRILEIEEVTIEDVGLYRITVENDYGRAEASARLEVITHKGKFYAGVRSCSPSPRRTMFHRRRTPSTSRQD